MSIDRLPQSINSSILCKFLPAGEAGSRFDFPGFIFRKSLFSTCIRQIRIRSLGLLFGLIRKTLGTLVESSSPTYEHTFSNHLNCRHLYPKPRRLRRIRTQ